MKISVIGAGNVAWHLAPALEDAGHHICEVYSHHLANAKLLVKKLFDSNAVADLDFGQSEAELFILAVPDDAISQVLNQLILPENSILVHTSGSKSIDVFKDWVVEFDEQSTNYGVFYPLMTFSKNKTVNFQEVPFCIEAHDAVTETKLVDLAQKISKIVYLVDTDERKILHLAAVFSNNFVNYLLAITQDILLDNDLEMSLLRPIIKETVAKALLAEDIYEVQTGPARRGDQSTIKSHIDLLRSRPQNEKIYRVLSEGIFNYFNP